MTPEKLTTNIKGLEALLKTFNYKDYVPYKNPELLPKDTVAPNWQLFSLTDEKISLSDIVLHLPANHFFLLGLTLCFQMFANKVALSIVTHSSFVACEQVSTYPLHYATHC